MSLARHTAYNLTGQLLPLVLSLLATPLYLRLIGEARFGVLALMWLFVGYMSLFDLGMGQAVSRQISQREGSSAALHAQALWTAMSISLGLGLVGALLAAPLGFWFFTQFASIDDGLRAELVAAWPWAASLVPVMTLTGVLSGALQARRAFGELNLFGVSANVLVLLAPLGVALLPGVQLARLAAAVVAARLLVLLLMFWRCRRHYLVGFPVSIDRGSTRQMLHFGGWTTVSAVISPLMVGLDRFAIGVQLGAKAVSHYVIPLQLAERTTMLSVALNHALFPRLASTGIELERRQLGMQAVRVVAAVMSPAVGAGLLLAGPFLAWWISPELAERSTAVAQILLLAFWINSLALVPYTKLLASGRPDLVAKSHVAELLPYLALLYFALQAWGLVGAALAFALRVTADFLILSRLAGMLNASLRLLAIPALLLAATERLASVAGLTGPWRWALGLGLIVALAGWSVTQAPPSLRRFRPWLPGS